MRLLVAVAAALFAVSAQAKMMDCTLHSLKDGDTIGEMQVSVLGSSSLIYSKEPKKDREGFLSVLFEHHSDPPYDDSLSLYLIQQNAQGTEFAPLTLVVNWTKGTMKSYVADADRASSWRCRRRD
jgi:hypothetical protein